MVVFIEKTTLPDLIRLTVTAEMLYDPAMTSLRKLRVFGKTLEEIPEFVSEIPEVPRPRSNLLITLGWISAGAGVLALGLVLGRELRYRYKFRRRTPYDFYAHAGDSMPDVEFGVGI